MSLLPRLLSCVLACTLAACGGDADPSPEAPVQGSGDGADENVNEPVDMCGDPSPFRVEAGSEFRAPSGLLLQFGGSSIDHYDDGHSETLLSLTLTKDGSEAPWLPSAEELPTIRHLLGHCVQLESFDGALEGAIAEHVPPH